jgi:hypothetical protein
MHVSWATPIASGRVTGAYQIEEPSPLGVTRFDLRGWRATLEHSWGSLNRLWPLFTGWEHAAVHTRHGPTWVLHGLTRLDFATGPGARDAFWQGLLTRVDARGVRVCRPALVRRVPDLHARPPVRTWIMRARCPGARLALRALSSTTFVTRSDDWDETESRVSSRPAGFGWWRSASQPGP